MPSIKVNDNRPSEIDNYLWILITQAYVYVHKLTKSLDKHTGDFIAFYIVTNVSNGEKLMTPENVRTFKVFKDSGFELTSPPDRDAQRTIVVGDLDPRIEGYSLSEIKQNIESSNSEWRWRGS